jgi:hypothetical protein
MLDDAPGVRMCSLLLLSRVAVLVFLSADALL